MVITLEGLLTLCELVSLCVFFLPQTTTPFEIHARGNSASIFVQIMCTIEWITFQHGWPEVMTSDVIVSQEWSRFHCSYFNQCIYICVWYTCVYVCAYVCTYVCTT